MKKTLTLALSLFTAAFFVASCDELTTIEIPFGLSTTHELLVQETTTAVEETVLVDLTTNADFNKHKTEIKECGVDSLQVRVTDLLGSSMQSLTGAVQIGVNAGGTMTDLVSITTPLNLFALQTQTADGSWVTLPTTAEGRQRLADLIKNSPHQATIRLTGTASEAPVDFRAHFKIHWSMVATENLAD